MPFTLGIDFGTSSVRALIVDTRDGREAGVAVVPFPTGKNGVIVDPDEPNLARQNPEDYLFGLERSVRGALAAAARVRGFAPEKVVGIGVDTTGSSPLPVDRENR